MYTGEKEKSGLPVKGERETRRKGENTLEGWSSQPELTNGSKPGFTLVL